MAHSHRLPPTPRLATPISTSTLHLRNRLRLPTTAEELDLEAVVLERRPSSRPSILPSAQASSISSAFRPDSISSRYNTAPESPNLTSSKSPSSIDPATSAYYPATPPHIHIPPRRSRPGFPNYENSWWPYFYANKGAGVSANSDAVGTGLTPAFHGHPYGSDGTSHSEFGSAAGRPAIPPLAADGHVVGEVMRTRESRGFNRQLEMAQIDGAGSGSSQTGLVAEYEVRPVRGAVGTAIPVDGTLTEKEKKTRRRWFSRSQRGHERRKRHRVKFWKEVKTVGRVTAVCVISVVTCCGGCSCFRPDRAG